MLATAKRDFGFREDNQDFKKSGENKRPEVG